MSAAEYPPCPFCRGSGKQPDGRGVCLRCEGTCEREPVLMLRAFEIGYHRGVTLVYGMLGLEAPPDPLATRAIGLDELRALVQAHENESLRHYEDRL